MTATGESPKRRGRPPSGGREAILDATLAILREQGIANLTSREVAARAGVSDASVYYHFRDRAGLLQAVFEHGMKPLVFMVGIDPETMDPPAVISGAFAALEQFFDDVLPVCCTRPRPSRSFGLRWPTTSRPMTSAPTRASRSSVPTCGPSRRRDVSVRTRTRDAIALMVIDCAFARAARRQMYLHMEDLLPSREALLDEISRLLS